MLLAKHMNSTPRMITPASMLWTLLDVTAPRSLGIAASLPRTSAQQPASLMLTLLAAACLALHQPLSVYTSLFVFPVMPYTLNLRMASATILLHGALSFE